jgi:hypothetical protein
MPIILLDLLKVAATAVVKAIADYLATPKPPNNTPGK